MQAYPLLLLRFFANILRKILRHNGEHGIDRQEILSNSRVLLTAGSETTATFLSGATYHLLRNPAVLNRVQSEIRTIFKSREDITLRSVSKPGLLPYLEAVIQESLRCYPSVPSTLPRRTGLEGAVIDGKFVPRNVRRILPPSLSTIILTFSDIRWRSSMVHIS